MVVWENGEMKKDDYKRFRIRTVAGADDFASLREVLSRRFGRALEQGTALPDLVLIDGGRGQLNVGLSVLQELGLDWIPVASLAKQQEEVYVGESLQPLALDPTSPALHTLQRIRDEAHRFAIEFHRGRRDKAMTRSALDGIPGVGPTRKRAILAHFDTPERVLAASRDELEAVPGLPGKVAREIHQHLHRVD
jgi:excinuclease ABC subunit C